MYYPKNQSISIVIWFFFGCVLVVAGVYYFLNGQDFFKNPPESTVYCTADAMLCPDGSYVTRTEPNCEFAECPTVDSRSAIEDFEKNTEKADTSDWKTYRNEEYGFDVKYPPGWTHGYDNPIAVGRDNFTHIRLQTDSTRSIAIQVIPGRVASESKNYEILELNGVQAVKFLDSSGGFSIFHRKPDFEIYINDTSKVAEYGNYSPVDPDVIEEIVSTFKFTK